MSDDPVRTRVATRDGWLDFQDYFVRLQCAPPVHGFVFAGADSARPASGCRCGAAPTRRCARS